MAPKKTKEKPQYYTIQFEKYIDVLEEINRFHYILSDKIKDLVNQVNLTEWTDSPIPEFMEVFTVVDAYKIFLDEKINNPSDEEIKFTTANNIKDVLFNEPELKTMQNYYLQIQARKLMLKQNYGFSAEYN